MSSKLLTPLKMVKQFVILLAIILVGFLSVTGQNWQTVRSGRITYFAGYQKIIKSLRIDSVKFDRDSVLYPMASIQQSGSNCFNPKGNSWIGKKVIIQSNGVNLFFNNNDDTIQINTGAKVGESWTLFEIKDSIKITAEVKSAEIQSIFGELDSVKTIGFKVYDKNGLVDRHYLSEKSLIISKNDGFVRMMNFNVFPKVPNASSFEILEPFDLIGLTNPDRGEQNLTWLRVHDFQVGNEIHIVKKSWDWVSDNKFYYNYKIRLKYLERREAKDSVIYRIEKEESIKKTLGTWDNVSYVYSHDTITEVYKPDTLFDKLPGEPIITDDFAHTNVMLNESIFVTKYGSEAITQVTSIESCWEYFLYYGGYRDYYYKGLGGPYYDYNEINRGEEKHLVYFKKGSTTWGTPLNFTNVESIPKKEEISVYPNPALDFITINNLSGRAERFMISLTDMQGREVLKNETGISTTYRLDVSSLKDGVYLLKLQNGENMISRMIVKKQ